MKDELVRFGVSLDGGLLRRFDAYLEREGYANRSQAIGALIRKEFVEEAFASGAAVAGAVTLVYDLRKREAANRLLDIQHAHAGLVISAQHVHLDHDNCLEIVAVKGPAAKVAALSDALKAVKGVKHAALSVAAAVK